jgi:hypothetical protein
MAAEPPKTARARLDLRLMTNTSNRRHGTLLPSSYISPAAILEMALLAYNEAATRLMGSSNAHPNPLRSFQADRNQHTQSNQSLKKREIEHPPPGEWHVERVERLCA